MSSEFLEKYSKYINKQLRDSLLNPNRISIIFNTSWLILERIFRIGLGFIVTAVMARYLGAEKFGILSYAISIVAILEPLMTLGLNSVLKKYILYNPEQKYILKGTMFALRLISTLAIIVTIFLVLPYYHKQDPLVNKVILVLSIGLLFKVFDIIDLWYESQVKSKYPTLIKSTSIVLTSILKLLLVYFKKDLVWFAYAIIAESLICTIGYIYFLNRHGEPIKRWSVSIPLIKKMLLEGWPLIFSSIAVMIYMKIDQVILHHIAGEREVGIYAAAVKLSEPWSFIAVNLVASTFPTMVLSKKKSLSDYYRKLQKMFSFMTIFALSVIIPTTLLADHLVSFIFGHDFISSAKILRVHIWANLFIFWAVAQDPWDIVEKHIKFVSFKTIFAAIMNISLNYVLIPKFGGLGAAWATVISYSMIFFLNFFHRKCRKAFWAQIYSLCFWKYLR